MQLEKLNVVAIGGGHGLGRVLSTLSFLKKQLTGIVTTTDNGGSTGRLRRRSSSIAWGDLRNCLTLLVDEDSVGSQLFDFRFDGQDELGGHNLGNLILYALGKLQSRPLDSIKLVRRLLGVRTPLYPMSETPTDLMAFYPKGRCKVGELSVDKMPIMPEKLLLAPLVKTLPLCIESIRSADLIILGPGSFLTSVIPPLLVRDITKAIQASSAHCVFIENLGPEDSPAAALSLDEKLNWIKENIGCLPINSVICHDETVTSTILPIIHCDLSDGSGSHYHDKEKLLQALKLCISGIDKQNSISA
ncbi:gluconeogenesis factor YvcK family protein [Colwellia hornerae]|uniref:Putative gluconeogenesis factor n=1 Tax=Colwellia hornerae TaxID=89402 RepID=A0A5C6QQR9_9GAMM|nr:uridine diphosphate-N-acetylglucosamine-binding protein YvcK [Colwellia hornerae]TWX57696.1 uridine diphosphate-N-acetylglucosamine-binding protein YvcK [Colwellia hornerae]TWX62573.1 uridine diphosphate-N-acetylglucosamine-binding protein YvcK [Colwellia hornerae]TWX71485.1 uridine diphosphate-N-acetylglucosamine-binding protein YvcK [Colwellia hornerae]